MWTRVRRPASPVYRALCFFGRYLAGRLYELRTGGIPPEREWDGEYLRLRRVDAWGWPEQAFIVRGSGARVYHGALRELEGSSDVGKSLAAIPATSYQDFSEVLCHGWRMQ